MRWSANRANYNGNGKVSTWIFAIAYRKAMKRVGRWDEAGGRKEQ